MLLQYNNRRESIYTLLSHCCYNETVHCDRRGIRHYRERSEERRQLRPGSSCRSHGPGAGCACSCSNPSRKRRRSNNLFCAPSYRRFPGACFAGGLATSSAADRPVNVQEQGYLVPQARITYRLPFCRCGGAWPGPDYLSVTCTPETARKKGLCVE